MKLIVLQIFTIQISGIFFSKWKICNNSEIWIRNFVNFLLSEIHAISELRWRFNINWSIGRPGPGIFDLTILYKKTAKAYYILSCTYYKQKLKTFIQSIFHIVTACTVKFAWVSSNKSISLASESYIHFFFNNVF